MQERIIGREMRQSPRELAKGMPPREIRIAAPVDVSRYSGDELRRIRADWGVGQVRRVDR